MANCSVDIPNLLLCAALCDNRRSKSGHALPHPPAPPTHSLCSWSSSPTVGRCMQPEHVKFIIIIIIDVSGPKTIFVFSSFFLFFCQPYNTFCSYRPHATTQKKRNIIPDIFGWTPSASSNNRWVGRWVDFSTAIYTVLFLLFRGSGLILPNATGWLTISRLDGPDYY